MFECAKQGPSFPFSPNLSQVDLCGVGSNSSYSQFSSDSLSSTIPFTEAIEVYVIGTLCILGVIGNALSIAVFRYDRLAREPLFLLSILAVVDGLYLVACLFRYPIMHALENWEYVKEYKLIVNALTFTMQTMAIWTMLPVTFDRYIAACHPFRSRVWCTRRNKIIAVVLVVIVAILYNVPRWLDSCIKHSVNPCTNDTIKYKIIKIEFASALYFDLYKSAGYLLFLYVFPLVALTGMNIRLIQAIMHSARRHRSISGRGDEQTEENNTTRVLVLVVIEFMVCQTPELVLRLLTVLNRHLRFLNGFMDELKYLMVICNLLLVINSSVNFVIYCIFGRKFRRQLKEIFTFKGSFTKTTSYPTTRIENDVEIPLAEVGGVAV